MPSKGVTFHIADRAPFFGESGLTERGNAVA